MKNKIACLTLASVMTAGFCLAGCGGDGGNYTEIDNADILALSYDRLENADLSFDFSIDKSVATASYSLAGETATLCGARAADGTVVLTPDEIIEPRYTSDFFKSNESNLERISRRSREMADYAIENVTVVDKFVDFGSYKYMLEYDRESDTVTVYNYMEWNGAISEYYKISIFYDEDGDETVEYWFHSPMYGDKTGGQTHHAIYCAGKIYYCVFNQFGIDSQGQNYATYNLTNAYKDGGKWRGLKTNFVPQNPVFTHEGEYNYANGIIGLQFMVEEGDDIYGLSDRLIPYRDGKVIGSGVEALPTDEFRFEQYYQNTSVVTVNFDARLIRINMAALDGWSQVKAFDDDGDTVNKLVLDNGKLVDDNALWADGYGWVYRVFDSQTSEEYYLTDDEQRLDYDTVANTAGMSFHINTGEPYGDDKIQNAFFEFTAGKSEGLSFDLVNDCLSHCGLTFNGEASRTMLLDMKNVQERKEQYLSGIYQRLCGGDYTVDDAVAYMQSIMSDLDGFEEEIVALVPQYETVWQYDIPEKPADLGLAEFGQNLSGKAVISEDGLDFSGVSLAVKRSPLLSTGKTYGVTVGFSSGAGSVLVEAFDGAVYEKADMTFTGKADAALPLAQEGEYTLVGFFGRADGNSMIRLSEICTLSVESFEDFEITRNTEDGVWTYEYKYVNGTAKLIVTFAPAEQS